LYKSPVMYVLRDQLFCMLSLPSSQSNPIDIKEATGYPLHLEGNCRIFVCQLPGDVLCDLSDSSKSRVYVYCWLDSNRGSGAHVHYLPLDLTGDSQGRNGEFKLSLDILPEEVDLLKVMCCIRVGDEMTNNRRTFTVGTGAVRLNRLVAGECEHGTLFSTFDQGNRAELRMIATNAHKFSNSRTSIAPVGGQALPLIRFRPSSLWQMGEIQNEVDLTRDVLKVGMDRCQIKPPPGGENFLRGLTRCRHFVTLDSCLLFVSLCLGTPAYVFYSCPRCSNW
jgi:hypothetical protein